MAPPKRDQIASDLRSAIERGDYTPGERLPTEAELVEKWKVSRPTVRDALGILISEGLISSARGRGQGYRVREEIVQIGMAFSELEKANARDDNTNRDNWVANLERLGRNAEQEVSVSIEMPSKLVASRLKITEDSPVVARHRIRRIDSEICQLSTSYFPEETVRGTPLIEPRDVSAPGGILASLGMHQEVFADEIFARMPTDSEKEQLNLTLGVPVAEHIRTGLDEDGKPLRCMVTVMPGDRTKITYELPAK